MLLSQDQEVVQAFSSQAPQKSFTYSVRFWCSVRRSQNVNACSDSVERWAVFAVVVPDQEMWSFSKWCGVAQLLSYPPICWVSGDAEVDDTAGAQLDDDEHEDGAEENVIGLKEVAGPDLTGVVAQKRGPVLLGWERTADLGDVLLDGALAHAQSELE